MTIETLFAITGVVIVGIIVATIVSAMKNDEESL